MIANRDMKVVCWLTFMLACAAITRAEGAEAEKSTEGVEAAKTTPRPTSSEPTTEKQETNPYGELLDRALKDKRYLGRQLKCILGEANCDLIGNRLKSYAPLVLRGACPASKCSQQEIRQIQSVLSHVQRNFPKEWNRILKQYTTGY